MKEQTGKGSSKGEKKKDRMSRTGITGSPKKGGHVGKFTWVGDRCFSLAAVVSESGAVDAKDPNFEDPQEDDNTTAVNAY